MPRWFIALILAFMLPCHALAAMGQTLAMLSEDGRHIDADLADGEDLHDCGGSSDAQGDDTCLHVDPDTPPDHAPLDRRLVPLPGATVDVLAASWHEAVLGPPFIEGPRRPPRGLVAIP